MYTGLDWVNRTLVKDEHGDQAHSFFTWRLKHCVPPQTMSNMISQVPMNTTVPPSSLSNHILSRNINPQCFPHPYAKL